MAWRSGRGIDGVGWGCFAEGMEPSEFGILLPLYIIAPREIMSGVFGCATSKHDGVEYALAFTDGDLAERYFQRNPKPGWGGGVIKTPERFQTLLDHMASLGITWIGFDTKPDGTPTKIMSVQDAKRSLL